MTRIWRSNLSSQSHLMDMTCAWHLGHSMFPISAHRHSVKCQYRLQLFSSHHLFLPFLRRHHLCPTCRRPSLRLRLLRLHHRHHRHLPFRLKCRPTLQSAPHRLHDPRQSLHALPHPLLHHRHPSHLHLCSPSVFAPTIPTSTMSVATTTLAAAPFAPSAASTSPPPPQSPPSAPPPRIDLSGNLTTLTLLHNKRYDVQMCCYATPSRRRLGNKHHLVIYPRRTGPVWNLG